MMICLLILKILERFVKIGHQSSGCVQPISKRDCLVIHDRKQVIHRIAVYTKCSRSFVFNVSHLFHRA